MTASGRGERLFVAVCGRRGTPRRRSPKRVFRAATRLGGAVVPGRCSITVPGARLRRHVVAALEDLDPGHFGARWDLLQLPVPLSFDGVVTDEPDQ